MSMTYHLQKVSLLVWKQEDFWLKEVSHSAFSWFSRMERINSNRKRGTHSDDLWSFKIEFSNTLALDFHRPRHKVLTFILSFLFRVVLPNQTKKLAHNFSTKKLSLILTGHFVHMCVCIYIYIYMQFEFHCL